MTDPYEVLGIEEGASKEEIKAAYREQVKKYHPDKHQDNPLYELAEERLQEVNEAYDYLMNQQGGSFSGTSSGSYGGQAQKNDPRFMRIRQLIDNRDLTRAENELNSMDVRNAEWHFLYGNILLRRGWYNDALNSIQIAVSMDPENREYQQAMSSIVNSSGGYASNSYNKGYSDASNQLCQCLSCYCLADCCCH